MTDAQQREAARRTIVEYLERVYPERLVDEYGERAQSWPADSELYPIWLAMSPEPLRVYVSQAALERLAGLVEEPGAIEAWLEAHDLAATIACGREVLVTSGGVSTVLDAE